VVDVCPEPLLGRLLPALGSVDTDQVLPTLSRFLTERIAAADVLVQLADYRKMTLQPLSRGGARGRRDRRLPRRAAAVDGSPAGLVFREQRTVIEPVDEMLLIRAPVSLRGQRLGVLSVLVPRPTDSPARDGKDAGVVVADAAAALALVMRVTGQGSDLFEIARRSGRLSVAAEMQWQLLPGTDLVAHGLQLAGHLEPAQRVGGDAFDWAQNPGTLWLTVVHAEGYADSASLACTLAVTALRNARRAELPLPRQAELTSEAVWAQFHGDRPVRGLLLELDRRSGRITAVHTGACHLLRVRDRQVSLVPLPTQPMFGVDEETDYHPSAVEAGRGDRLLVVTDGAVTAPDPAGEPFGVHRLIEAFRERQELSPPEVVRLIVRDLLRHAHDELPTDASVVCLDWQPQR
jgi:serine phosphatase RsbU (regulator of sigma subunit)